MGKRLGIDRIARYAKEFGFGKMSGFDLGQEKSGLVPSKAWKLKKLGYPWQEGETISTSIGQSFLLVTPVQMATMIASVFNGGILYQPQVTKWIGKSETDKIYEFSPRISEKLNINKRHLEIVKNALTAVVNEPRGTGSKARMENITVAGKTGTAQVVSLSQDSGGIHNKDHAWFVAVAPAESPEIALAIVIEHGGHGGSAAAPIAKEIMDVYFGTPEISSNPEPITP